MCRSSSRRAHPCTQRRPRQIIRVLRDDPDHMRAERHRQRSSYPRSIASSIESCRYFARALGGRSLRARPGSRSRPRPPEGEQRRAVREKVHAQTEKLTANYITQEGAIDDDQTSFRNSRNVYYDQLVDGRRG
jgi:hypothetical protein